ncbi:hypothetical protein HanPI659440_Chr03g0104551 [Helianthus annuus]|nr:hypothetical protein HanPI659440_Chr03g0104551 [Helianthus annuus]
MCSRFKWFSSSSSIILSSLPSPCLLKVTTRLFQALGFVCHCLIYGVLCFADKVTFQRYGTVGIGEPMGIRVLSGVHFLEVLAYLLPLCNEDTGPVTLALIFRGVTFGPPLTEDG